MANISSASGREIRLKWFEHVTRQPLGHGRRQIIHMKPRGRRGRPRTGWMDDVDRDMKVEGLERKMASQNVVIY